MPRDLPCQSDRDCVKYNLFFTIYLLHLEKPFAWPACKAQRVVEDMKFGGKLVRVLDLSRVGKFGPLSAITELCVELCQRA